MTREQAAERAAEVRGLVESHRDSLFAEAAEAARKAAWVVHCASNLEDLGEVVAGIARDAGAKSALRSTHEVLENSPIDKTLHASGVSIRSMHSSDDESRAQMRSEVFQANLGITGVDWFIAETGTVVLRPRQGVSRLVSLAPPRHIAVLQKGAVLPSLDELFALERADQLDGVSTASMNLISGPSRTGDIEATIVTGIHGPFEVHLVMLG